MSWFFSLSYSTLWYNHSFAQMCLLIWTGFSGEGCFSLYVYFLCTCTFSCWLWYPIWHFSKRKIQRYYPTRLAINLASSQLDFTSVGKNTGYLMVETNYRVYAYTGQLVTTKVSTFSQGWVCGERGWPSPENCQEKAE